MIDPQYDNMDKTIDQIVSLRAAGERSALGVAVFAGGFSFGVQQGGFEVVGHLEHSEIPLGVVPASSRWPVTVGDAQGWYDMATRMRVENAVPDLVYMNPPCSAFAKQGNRNGMDDTVMCYTRYCVEFALALMPNMFVWELVEGVWDDVNVPQVEAGPVTPPPDTGFDETNGRLFVESVARRARAHGYSCCVFLTSSALHGGAQNRVRFHFIAVRSETPPDWNAVAEGLLAAQPPEHTGWRTLGDVLERVEAAAALGPLPNHIPEDGQYPGGALLDIMPYTPPGSYLRDVHDEAMRRYYHPRNKEWDGTSRAGVTQVRGRRDRTCPVIVGGTTVIHPEEDRFLTVREAATAMGFPLDYEFSDSGSRGSQEVGKGLTTHNARFVALLCAAGFDAAASMPPPDPAVVSSGTVGWLQVVDWRPRVSVPSQTSSPEEREAWWRAKHPDLPVEWCHGVKGPNRGRRGRPRGSKNKKPYVEPPPPRPRIMPVAIDDPHHALVPALARMGLDALSTPVGKGSILIMTSVPTGKASTTIEWYFKLGKLIGEGVRVMVHNMKIEFEDEPMLISLSGDTAGMAIAVAKAAGMTDAEILAKIQVTIDPAELLRRALAGAA